MPMRRWYLRRLNKSGLETCVEHTLRNVLYNKLLLNLVNPVNAQVRMES